MRKSIAAIVLALGLGASAPASAADLPMPTPQPTPMTISSGWHFEATIDGWAPSLWAGVGVGRFPVANVYANVFTILRHLEGIAPFSAAAYNENFVVGADLFWTRVGVSGNFKPGDGSLGGVNAALTLNETFFTAYGGVRLPIASPALNLYGIAGARIIDVNASLDLNVPVVGFSRSASQGRTWADPIFGVFARYRFNDKWIAKFEADGGGYGGSATAQVYAALGYNWTPNITSSAGLRYLYAYEQGSPNANNGSFRFRQTLFGPTLDTSINF
jgi:hypothetical protein